MDSEAETVSRHRPRVVAVVGSPRRGNTRTLVDAALDELERRGFACDRVLLGSSDVRPCLGHDDCGERDECPLDDDAAAVLDKVYAADCLILASPVYYENVSAQMKAFIDRNVFSYAHERRLAARVVGLIAVTAETGLDDAFAALRRYVALSAGDAVPVLSAGGLAERAGDAAADPELIAAARGLAAELAAVLA